MLSWARRQATTGLLLFLFAFLVFELSANVIWATDHSISFMKLDYALISHHSPAFGEVGDVPPWTVDQFSYGGQNYSALAPGTAFFALPFMAAAFSIWGGFTAYGPSLLLSETMVALAAAASAYLVFKIAGLYFEVATSLLLGLAFAFSTICWPFATYFFQSDVSAMLVLAAAYFALKAGRSEGAGRTSALLCGVAVGLAFMVDYVNLVLVPVFLVFLAVKKRGSFLSLAGATGWLLLGAMPGIAAIGAYNFAIFGSPLMTTEQAYMGKSLLAEFTTPLTTGIALNLFSPSRGILVFAPIAVLGVLGYVDALKIGRIRAEMVLMAAIFLGILVPYSAWYDPFGGISFGPRFLVAGIPFLLIPAGYFVEQAKGARALMVYGLYAAGAAINGMGAFVTAIPPVTPFGVSPLAKYVVPLFAEGKFDSLWAAYLGGSWVVGAALIVVLGIAVPIAWVEAIRRRRGRPIAVDDG